MVLMLLRAVSVNATRYPTIRTKCVQRLRCMAVDITPDDRSAENLTYGVLIRGVRLNAFDANKTVFTIGAATYSLPQTAVALLLLLFNSGGTQQPDGRIICWYSRSGRGRQRLATRWTRHFRLTAAHLFNATTAEDIFAVEVTRRFHRS